MGREVELVPVLDFAVAAGVKSALEKCRDNPYLDAVPTYDASFRRRATNGIYVSVEPVHDYYGAVKDPFYTYSEYPKETDPLFFSSRRGPHQLSSREYDAMFNALFETCDEELIEAAVREKPEHFVTGYRWIADKLDEEAVRVREDYGITTGEIEAGWPRLVEALLVFGPLDVRRIEALPSMGDLLQGFCPNRRFFRSDGILKELVYQGRLVLTENDEYHYYRDDVYYLSESSLHELGMSEAPEPKSMEEQIKFLLHQYCPAKVSVLASVMRKSESRLRKTLNQLMAEGAVVRKDGGRGKPHLYWLAEDSPMAAEDCNTSDEVHAACSEDCSSRSNSGSVPSL